MSDFSDKMYILGCGISHSKSPDIWSKIFRERKLTWSYEKCDIDDVEVAKTFVCERAFRAINITTPYKNIALELSDVPNSISKFCGGCNFLVNDNDTLYGYNTDGYGCVLALLRLGHDVGGKRVVVCGSGPTARSIASATAESGGVVVMLTRDASKLKLTCEMPANMIVLEYGEADRAIKSADMIVNATTLGMNGEDGSPINKELLDETFVVYDCVYGHGITQLSRDCKERGATYYSGDDMLFWQAKKCEEILFS